MFIFSKIVDKARHIKNAGLYKSALIYANKKNIILLYISFDFVEAHESKPFSNFDIGL